MSNPPLLSPLSGADVTTKEDPQLQIWESLKLAQIAPLQADVFVLWEMMLETINDHDSIEEQLELSAEAILQIAEVALKRAHGFAVISAQQLGKDPVMPANAFDRFVRQSMDVDLDQFVEEFGRKEHDYPDNREAFSIVSEVAKEEILAALPIIDEADEIEQLEYDENVGAWAEVVLGWLKYNELAFAEITHIHIETGLTLGQLWLSGLLKLEIQQGGQFYETERVAIAVPASAKQRVA
jgi:hypothetical protein